jgi:hypothetical protein
MSARFITRARHPSRARVINSLGVQRPYADKGRLIYEWTDASIYGWTDASFDSDRLEKVHIVRYADVAVVALTSDPCNLRERQ